MKFELDLNNPSAFTSVAVPTPTDRQISEHLYEKEPRVLAFSRYSQRSEDIRQKEKFIAQWEALAVIFADIMLKETRKSMRRPCARDHSPYPNLIAHLQEGITESIIDEHSGLLPNQPAETFSQLKIFLEGVCLYCIQHSGSKFIESLLSDLHGKLELCGPGLFVHLQQAFYELYHPTDSLFYWLADHRQTIVHGLAKLYCDKQQVADLYQSHVYTAFSAYAKEHDWNLLQEIGDLQDIFIGMVIPSLLAEEIYSVFHQSFEERYATESIKYLSERLSAFLRHQFHLHATKRGRFSSLSSQFNQLFDEFFKTVNPVLDSFGLSIQYFLITKREMNPVRYCLNEAALSSMEIYVAAALCMKDMLDINPLYLLREISDLTFIEKLIQTISAENLLCAFQYAFNATPPEHINRFERRARTEKLQFFPSTPAFTILLRQLGLLTRTTSAIEQLTIVLHSNHFDVFMSEQLKLSDFIRVRFLRQYAWSRLIPVAMDPLPRRYSARR